ncbi:MAG TPA: glycosyltransferase family 4 protein [Lutibacter sp.]|nr:glycosyltransferase family 4 protein [Lutibacter sp.]
MRRALIHDWFYVYGGAEKVVKSIMNIYPDLEPHALIDFLDEKDRASFLKGKKAKTSFIQNLPFVKKNHRKYLQLFPKAIEQFDLREYDLILSTSSSVAKGVLTNASQLHICYIHSPVRYAWDLYHQYLQEAGLEKGLKAWYAKRVLHKLRLWDIATINRVDYYIANSKYIAKRVKKLYNREATVIYPPVDVNSFTLETEKEDYYLAASRLVSYKKLDIIVAAFSKMPNKKLVVIGDGPEMDKLQKLKKDNISLLGYQPKDSLVHHMQKAKAFVFAAEEDFGIIPVEAQACGTPVIAFGKGGALETVVDNETGIFFHEQTADSIIEAVHNFEKQKFDTKIIRKNAEKFSVAIFEKKYSKFVEKKYATFRENLHH